MVTRITGKNNLISRLLKKNRDKDFDNAEAWQFGHIWNIIEWR